MSKEQLLAKIEGLEMLTRQLLDEKEQEAKLAFAWTGNLGHWYWNVKTNEVTFNPLKTRTLGYGDSEVPEPVTYQFFTDMLHPEDLENTMDAMRRHLYGKAGIYEVEYRIRAKDGTYKWFYDRGKITQRDEKGKPSFLAGIVFDITDKKEALFRLEKDNLALSEMAAVDGLTGLYNHRALIERLKAEIYEADRTGSPLSIAMLDADNFKQLNDTQGHVFGDQVLVNIAGAITGSVRNTDYVGRYGGEEFMVIFPNAPLSMAWKISERIRQGVASHPHAGLARVTLSGGVAQYNGETLTELVQLADAQLYRAKAEGKNRIMLSV
ncbi:MAG: sensor domain-containing diguanylate cyclase [Eubacteriales bacterium]|nr:sensor domain-containing diguanylate cyclase [Eubacteriales bacterium]